MYIVQKRACNYLKTFTVLNSHSEAIKKYEIKLTYSLVDISSMHHNLLVRYLLRLHVLLLQLMLQLLLLLLQLLQVDLLLMLLLQVLNKLRGRPRELLLLLLLLLI